MGMKAFFKKHFQKIDRVKEEIEQEELWDLSEGNEADEASGDILLNGSLWNKLRQHRRGRRRHWMVILGILGILAAAFFLYLFLHVGTEFTTISRTKRADINGTKYTALGGNLLKYSSDGVSCVSHSGEVLWSSTYSMQSPVIDICGSTAAVADQKGTQIYIYNDSGLLGQFQTSLPIEKVRVARQGVVCAVLQDDDVTWINFYDSEGNEIAKNRTSLGESGYPLDIALSPDGLKLMVSYLCITKGIMNTRVSFYNFDSVGQAEINNMVSSETYENVVVPKVIFMDTDTSVAFRSNGFSIFKGRQIPALEKEEEFEHEILSVFYDEEYFGFVFKSDKAEHKYMMQLYNQSGKKVMSKYFDLAYDQVKLEEDNLILFNESTFEIYGTGGRKKFSGKYKKPIVDVISIKGFRKYMVLTQESTDVIRLK